MMEHNDRPMILLAEPDTVKPVNRRHSRAQHLKKRRGRTLFRLGVSFFTMLVLTAMLPLGGTFSKYTSQSPELTIPPLTAGSFAFKATEMTKEEMGNYGNTIGLSENEILAYAFTVSNSDTSGKVSDVDMTCNLDFRAKMNLDIMGDWKDVTLGNLYNVVSAEIKVYLYVDGTKVTELQTDGLSAAATVDNPVIDDPMPIATYLPYPLNYYLRNSDAISFKAGQSATHTCAIVFDVSAYEFSSDIPVVNPDIDPTITITANQVKGGCVRDENQS